MTTEQLAKGLEIKNKLQYLEGELSEIEAISAYSDIGEFDDAYVMVSHMHWNRKFKIKKQYVLDCLRERKLQLEAEIPKLKEEFKNL